MPTVEFIRLPTFEKSCKGLLDEQAILELEIELMLHPDAGDPIPGARGLRKLRRPAKGRGKRGGTRVIYYHAASQQQILLIFAFSKNERSDLSVDQLRRLAGAVKAEFP